MKRGYSSVLILVAGVAIGLAASSTIRAQQTPPGYVVFEVNVTDPATFKGYSAQVPATLAPYGGKYLVRFGKITPVEGDPPRGNFGVIAFDSVEKAEAWENSQAYEAIKPIRQKSATSRIFIVQGAAAQ